MAGDTGMAGGSGTAGTGKGGAADTEQRLRNIQKAIYFLIWKRSGFGEHCIHCGHKYPDHENKCKAAEVEQLIR